MNFSIAARVVISLMILVAGCGRASQPNSTAPATEQTSTAPTRRPSPDELKTLMPPRLQGPEGPYTNTRSSP